MNLQNLGGKIRSERISRGITQEQLAEQIGISTNFMSLIENGRNMSVEVLVKISIALSVSVDYLLNETINVHTNKITEQITQNVSTLSDDEKLYFLNMIKQYKAINKK